MRSARFDSSTGKRRGFWYSWRALAAGLALALVAGGGIAVAAVSSPADAHNRAIDITCSGITVHGDNYNNNGGQNTNTVTVTIAGVQQTDNHGSLSPISFDTGYDGFFAFADPTHSYAYSATIIGWDGYETTKTGTSVACAPPTVTVDIPACTVAGATLDLTATLGQLDNSHAYTIALSSADPSGTNVAAAGLPGGFSTPNFSFVFHGVVPGHVYTVTLIDTTVNLTATGTKASTGCPKDSDIDVAAAQCTVAGGTGGLSVTVSSLSFGRAYTITVLDAANVVVKSQGVIGDLTGTATVSFTVAGGGTYKAAVTDDLIGATSTKTSAASSYLPCPKTPDLPEVDPTQCTSTNGVPDSSIVFSASGLVPGRSYQVTVSNGTTNVFDSGSFVASASNWPVPTGGAVTASETLQVPPGTYTVFVTDVLLNVFVNSNSATIADCPTMPLLDFTPTQCTVPGGTGSIATSVTTYVPGRAYLVGLTLVQGGATVVAPTSIVAPASGAWILPPFANLAPGTQYRVTVTDSVVTSVSAYGDISLNPCPGTPTVTVQATCNVLGASTANVNLDKLEATETYTVTITKLSNNTVIGTQTVPGTTATAALQFKNVPNGNQYIVNVSNASNTLTGSVTFFLKDCDLPTLAFTGANPVGPGVAGIVFLQFGLVLVGLGLVAKRRRRTA